MKNSRDKFDRWLVASIALHAGIVFMAIVAPSLLNAHTGTWGSRAGGNGGVNIKIVTNISGIALPTPPASADETTVGKNQSLHKTEAPAKAKEAADPDALKLPSTKVADKKPVKPSPAQTAAAAEPSTPSNAVSYGTGGGNPSLRYGQTAPGSGPTGAEIGGDGTFGDKYGFYVDAMTRAISNEWVKVGVSSGPRSKVYVTFSISRDGRILNPQVEPGGGTSNPLMERAALRAVQAAKLNPLPPDYRGPDVSVRFYFDYAR